MHACRFIVCERTDRWAVAFRRRLPVEIPRVYETRSLRGLWEEVDSSPRSAVLIDIPELEDVQPSAAWIYEARRAFPHVLIAAALPHGLNVVRPALCEWGVETVISSTALLGQILPTLTRHFQINDSGSSQRDMVDRLPWPQYATSTFITDNVTRP